jgi:hypothetical protein
MTVPKRFDLLRFVATMLKVFAWITLVLSILSAIGVVLAGGQMGTVLDQAIPGMGAALSGQGGLIGGIIAAVGVLLVGVLYFVILYEENTRLTAALLLKMHQDTQVDTRTPYAGGFANEPEPYNR